MFHFNKNLHNPDSHYSVKIANYRNQLLLIASKMSSILSFIVDHEDVLLYYRIYILLDIIILLYDQISNLQKKFYISELIKNNFDE